MKNISRRETIKIIGASGIASFLPFKLFSNILIKGNEECKKAWVGLSKYAINRYQFRYIEPVEGLPKVFIYGDSISIGYTEYVRASLSGKACVYRLQENGGSSDTFIPKMEKLKKTMFRPYLKNGWNFKWDLICFNVGLHDLKYLKNGKLNKKEGKQVSSLETYEKNLIGIVEYLKTTYPHAKLIFSTTTPVPEGEPGRNAGDSKKYNEVAKKVMRKYKDITIDDLYKFSVPIHKKYAQSEGNVHYLPEGSGLQGIEVANVIGKVLDIIPVECPPTSVILDKFKKYEGKKPEIIH